MNVEKRSVFLKVLNQISTVDTYGVGL